MDLLNKLDKEGKIKIGDTGIPKTLSSTGRLKDAADLGGVTKGGAIYINPNSKLDRIDLRDGAAAHGEDAWLRFARRIAGHGFQVDKDGRTELAHFEGTRFVGPVGPRREV